jgi:hypothetical protein
METDFSDDAIRSPTEVARRALALFAVVGLGLGADRSDVVDWLTESDLWDDLTPWEIGFVEKTDPPTDLKKDASWHIERLIVLAWALGGIDQLPPANEQCDSVALRSFLPPYAPTTVEDFVESARLRPSSELLELAEKMYDLHAEGRYARSQNRPPCELVEIEIVQERHHAINWVTGYEGLPWDQVTTDT